MGGVMKLMMKRRGKMKMMTTMGELLQSCPDPQFAGPLEQEWKTATLHCKLHFTAIIISIGTIVIAIAINIIFSSIHPHHLRNHQKSTSRETSSSSWHSCHHKNCGHHHHYHHHRYPPVMSQLFWQQYIFWKTIHTGFQATLHNGPAVN